MKFDARVASNRSKYDRGLTQFRRHTLQWLDVADRIGSGSGCASKCTSVSTTWLPDIWPSSADLSPTSTVTGIYLLRCSASQTVNIQRTHVLLCRTFSLERCSWLLKNDTLSLFTFRHQIKHFCFSFYYTERVRDYFTVTHCANYLLTYCWQGEFSCRVSAAGQLLLRLWSTHWLQHWGSRVTSCCLRPLAHVWNETEIKRWNNSEMF